MLAAVDSGAALNNEPELLNHIINNDRTSF